MKKLMCLLVVFLISNSANAADKWAYVHLTLKVPKIGAGQFTLFYPDGKTDVWTVKETKPPKNFKLFTNAYLDGFIRKHDRPLPDESISAGEMQNAVVKKDFSKAINVVNVLGLCGFEMVGNTTVEKVANRNPAISSWWFKTKNPHLIGLVKGTDIPILPSRPCR